MSDTIPIDLDTARSMADSFAAATGVRCRLISAAGETLYQSGRPEDECAYLKALPGTPPPCWAWPPCCWAAARPWLCP